MSNLSEKILKLITEKGISYRELSKQTNIPASALQRYSNGITEKIPINRVKDIAKALGVSAEYLLGWAEEPGPVESSDFPNAEFVPTICAPLFASVSAGFGSTREEAIGTFPCVVRSEEEAENTLCVIVSGDSMYPDINNGDIIQVRRQTSVDYGDIAVVSIDGEHFVKKVEYGADYIRLVSLNEKYPPRVLKGAEVLSCSVVGKVVGSFKRF